MLVRSIGKERGVTIEEAENYATKIGKSKTDAAYFEHKTVIIPADDKRDKGGEDSADACDNMLVVGDGVGGWILQGIDSSIYSKKLTAAIVEDHL